METGVYVDVLLVINYVVNILLITCSAKLSGRSPARRRIVAAALVGSVSSLTIFLPFFGFFTSILAKLLISMAIVRTAYRYINIRTFFKELFVFFAVSFSFAGIMLGLWLAFRPRGMVYYNGIVYFHISSFTLIVTTVAAYGLLTLFHRFSRAGRVPRDFCAVQIFLAGQMIRINGLVDTGNSLKEPFSGTPVIVCGLQDAAPLFSEEVFAKILGKEYLSGGDCGIPLRIIPYNNVGGPGVIPAFKPDKLILIRDGERSHVEQVYVGLSDTPIGDGSYNAILNPDLVGFKITSGGVIK